MTDSKLPCPGDPVPALYRAVERVEAKKSDDEKSRMSQLLCVHCNTLLCVLIVVVDLVCFQLRRRCEQSALMRKSINRKKVSRLPCTSLTLNQLCKERAAATS